MSNLPEKKVFGYPKYDSENVMIISTYDNEYRDMLMDVRLYKLSEGEERIFLATDEETAVLLLNGDIIISWGDNIKRACRESVYVDGPYALHVSKSVSITVKANVESEILVQKTQNAETFDSKFYTPSDAPWKYAWADHFGQTAKRRVNTIFDYNNAPYSNMVLGEVLNDPGNWSGYVPHLHPQPELYFFRFDRPEGFGASFVDEDVYYIKDYSFSAIPGGKTHPQSSAPGYSLYTCWMIRHLDGNPWTDREDDPKFLWLYDAEFEPNGKRIK